MRHWQRKISFVSGQRIQLAVKISTPNDKSKKINLCKKKFLHAKTIMQLNGKLKYMGSAQNVLNTNLWIASQMAISQLGMKFCNIYCTWQIVTLDERLTMK